MKPIMIIMSIVGLFFGFLAAVMAYLITYEEYTHHFADTKEPKRLAMRTAIFAFTFFLSIAILGGFLLGR